MNLKLNIALSFALVLCALLLVTSQQRSRTLFVELEKSYAAKRRLELEWSQMQLAISSLGKNERVDVTARKNLNMQPLTPERTQFIPQAK